VEAETMNHRRRYLYSEVFDLKPTCRSGVVFEHHLRFAIYDLRANWNFQRSANEDSNDQTFRVIWRVSRAHTAV